MIKNRLLFSKELEKANSFWITGEPAELKGRKLIKRKKIEEIIEEISARRIIVLTGPRRAGKTILLKQCIQELCRRVPCTNILYYSMDDPSLSPFSDNLLKDMIDYFTENIAKKGRKYIFLDEVHLYKDWYKWLKSYYDRYPDIKFVVSGSSSLSLQKDANKYLRGRTLEFELSPLTFREFLQLYGAKPKIKPEFEKLGGILSIDHFKLRKTEMELSEAFKEYLLVGGFPEWFEVRDIKRWFSRLINDVPKKALYEDLVELFGIKSPKTLERMLVFMLANQSRVLSFESINEIARVDRGTLVNYIEFLKASYLVIEILKFARNVKEQLKSMKKYLATDQGLRNALMKDYALKEDNIGFVIENSIGAHLSLLAKERDAHVFYLKRNSEVDFIYVDKNTMAIEIKYRKKPEIKSGVVKMLKPITNKAIVITKDILKREKRNGIDFLFIPAWIFLLCE